jgi:hypothetical protein
MTEALRDQEDQYIEEDDQLFESSGQEVAAKMMKSKTMKPFAAKVAKMPKVTRADLEKMLPDYVDGGEITKLFKEEVEEIEEDEQLDELSKDTLKKYADKAASSKDTHQTLRNIGLAHARAPEDKGDKKFGRKEAGKHQQIANKRQAGIDAANKRLNKEETEQTGEYMEDQEKDFDASQDIDAIFSGEGLSEEFKSNAKAIFEAAVLAQVEERSQKLDEEYAQKLEEEIATINENIVSKVDEYLEYVVNEWIEDNQISVDSGLRAEIAEDFMNGLKTLFAEHYIDVPDEKADIVEELVAKVEALETELDKSITESKQLSDAIGTYKKEIIVDEISEGLTEVQAAKLRSLAENIEFISEEDYAEKVSLTKKKYFSEGKEIDVPTSSKEDQYASTEESLDESYSPSMAHYVKSISRTLKK